MEDLKEIQNVLKNRKKLDGCELVQRLSVVAVNLTTTLKDLKGSTTSVEREIAMHFRWDCVSATGAWTFVTPDVTSMESYTVPKAYRHLIGSVIRIVNETHFRKVMESVWHSLKTDRNTAHASGYCPSRLPILRSVGWISTADGSGFRPDDYDSSPKREDRNECSDCPEMLWDLLWGFPLVVTDSRGKETGPSQGLFLKLNRMAAKDRDKVHPTTCWTALESLLIDRRRTWASQNGGKTRIDGLLKRFGLDQKSLDGKVFRELARQAGYSNQRTYTAVCNAIVDNVIRSHVGGLTFGEGQTELWQSIDRLKSLCSETWFDENILAPIMDRDVRAQTSLNREVDHDSKTESGDLIDPNGVTPWENEIEQLGDGLSDNESLVSRAPAQLTSNWHTGMDGQNELYELKFYFLEACNTYQAETPMQIMKRALRQFEESSKKLGLSILLWSDSVNRYDLLAMARRWFAEDREYREENGEYEYTKEHAESVRLRASRR